MHVEARVKDKELVNAKRLQIIEGAVKVFKKKGYHKATIREIASEAGISLGSIYDYFSAKDDILYLFFDNYSRTFFAKLAQLNVVYDDPARRLEVTYRAVLEVLMELRDQVLLAYTQARYVKKNRLEEILSKESEIILFFQKILQQMGMSPHEALLEANFLVFSGVFGVLRRWALKDQFQDGEIVEFLVQGQMKRIASTKPKDMP